MILFILNLIIYGKSILVDFCLANMIKYLVTMIKSDY